MKTIAAVALALLSVSAAHAQTALKLRCEGAASRTVADMSNLHAYDNDGHTADATETSYRRVREDASVAFEMTDGIARIRLPADMVPLISGGGNAGWWTVTDLQVTDDEIEGRYALNIINHPRIRIDRHSGTISVEGRRAFHGACESVADAPRKF